MASSGQYDTVTVVIGQYDSLFKFFESVNKKAFGNHLRVIFPAPYVSKVVRASWVKKIWHITADIGQHRRYFNDIYNKYFAGLEGSEIMFGPGYTGLEISFLRRFIKRNRVTYFSPETVSQMVRYVPHSIREWLILIIFKLTYGWQVSLGQVPQVSYLKGFLYLPGRTIAREADKVIGPEQRAEFMKEFNAERFRVFDSGKHKVIYFHDDFVEAPYSGVDVDVVNRELTEIFQVLSKHFTSGEMATKFTPASAPKPRPQIGDILPAFIPAELLYNDNVVVYLSIASGAIFNVEKGTAVSLLDLITFKDSRMKEQVRQAVLQRKRSNILFPKSLDDFEQIVIDLKNTAKI
jgi:hypothetical protein